MTPLKKTLIGSASAIAYGALVWTFSVSPPPPPGDGTLSIVTTTDAEKSATLALVAPTAMWFDAIPSGLGADPVVLPPLDYATTPANTDTSPLIHDPAFQEVFYFWKLTTTPVGYRTTYHDTDYNMPTAWNDRRIAYGQKVAFCFDTPGNYVLECFAVGPTGLTAFASTSFTIADPDTAYSGTATLCVNPAGDTDFAWAPSGSTNYSTGADDRAVVNTMLTDYRAGTTSRRILFKPGATFNMRGAELGNWSNSGDTRLRHYVGSPLGESPAIFDLGVTANGPKFNTDGDHASITVSNMEFVGPYDPVAMVPKHGDGFLQGFNGIDANPPWALGVGLSMTTHFTGYRVKMRDFRGSHFVTPFQVRADRGVSPRTAFAECDVSYGNFNTAWFQNPSRTFAGDVIPVSDPRSKVAFIGLKLVAPSGAKEYGNHGYTIVSGMWPMRFTYIGELYMGACDLYLVSNTIDPIIRAHAGAFHHANDLRAGWQYLNFDRIVGETAGAQGIAQLGTQEPSKGSNPCNVVMDKVLHISSVATGHRTITGGHVLAAGTYRNIVSVAPPTNLGTTFIASGWPGDMVSNYTFDLAHPRRIHNWTVVGLANNGDIGYMRPLIEANAISALPNLTLENNIVHFPNQTLNETTAFKQTGLTSGTLAGVTPRYPGRNDPADPITLTGLDVANGATFDVLFTTIDNSLTRVTSRAYTAASQAYWTDNPTHNFHFIRQPNFTNYRYVYSGDLSVEVLSDRLRFTNNTGGTLSGDWQIWIDRRGLHPGPQASTATPPDMPLSWSPGSGSSAFPASGLQAFDTFLGTVRVGNTIPTGSGLTQATGADPKGAFGQA